MFADKEPTWTQKTDRAIWGEGQKKGLKGQGRRNGIVMGGKCMRRGENTLKVYFKRENNLSSLNNSYLLATFLPDSMKSISVYLCLGDKGEYIRE